MYNTVSRYILVYDQNIYQFHKEVKENENSPITKQKNFLHRETFWGFSLKCNQQADDFEQTLLIMLAIIFFVEDGYEIV